MKIKIRIIFLAVLFVYLPIGFAGNVDLSTVPARDTVQLTIYNSEDITLVKERRQISFKQGMNPLQFSWANTLIDASSVELRFIDHADQLELIDTTFPHAKPQKLYWNVQSEFVGAASVEISYFTSGITWSADYTGISNPGEDKLDLKGFVKVINNSGEEYINAQVRLVVGTINLVEKIAELAGMSRSEYDGLGKSNKQEYKRKAARAMLSAPVAEYAAQDRTMETEKQIIKEGLSEYFIYTIEGTETIPNGWSKRLRSFAALDVPFEIKYRYRPDEYGNELTRLFILTNDKKSGIGTTPLPNGDISIYRDTGRDGMSFLAHQTIKYVPIGDKLELNLGQDHEVIFELIKLKAYRDNLWMVYRGGKVHKKIDDHTVKFEHTSRVDGWDEHGVFSQRIRNYSNKPIHVEVRRPYYGDVEYRSELEAKLHNYQTVEYSVAIKPGEKKELLHEIITRSGFNAKKSNVKIKKAIVKI